MGAAAAAIVAATTAHLLWVVVVVVAAAAVNCVYSLAAAGYCRGSRYVPVLDFFISLASSSLLLSGS